MKEIKAIIHPHMLDKAMEARHYLPHFPGVTVSDCQGRGRGPGPSGLLASPAHRVPPLDECAEIS